MLKRGSAVVAGLLLNAVVLSTLIVSHPTAAVACPDEPPKTLLQLYKSSETIYVARYAKTEKGELVQKEDYKAYPIKKYFDVSTTLKGESKKMFVLEEEEYVYDDPEPVVESPNAEHSEEHTEETPEIDEEELGGDKPLKEGENVILFLKRDTEDAKKIVLADFADGARRVESGDVKTYEKRIRELNGIFAGKKADDAKVVDWLVRISEDPLTRWDGTFELLQAYESLEYNEAQKEEEAKAENGPTGEDGDIIEDEPEAVIETEEEVEVFDNAIYATLLHDGHKQRLSHILLNRDESSPALAKGDAELIELVKRWGDNEVGRFLVEKVRSGAYQPSETARMMVSAAKIFNDKQLAGFAEKYEEFAWGDEAEEIYSEPEEVQPEAKTDEKSAPKTESESVEKPVAAEKKATAKKPTYGQQRTLFSEKFLARADAVMAKQKALAAKKEQN